MAEFVRIRFARGLNTHEFSYRYGKKDYAILLPQGSGVWAVAVGIQAISASVRPILSPFDRCSCWG